MKSGQVVSIVISLALLGGRLSFAEKPELPEQIEGKYSKPIIAPAKQKVPQDEVQDRLNDIHYFKNVEEERKNELRKKKEREEFMHQQFEKANKEVENAVLNQRRAVPRK